MDQKFYLMQCGHVGNSHDLYGNPLCAICFGINDGADIIEKECVKNIGLEGRIAKCTYGDKTTKSKWSLPMFKYCPEEEFDEYYCGCYGWN